MNEQTAIFVGKCLRAARKLCQMSISEVSEATGVEVSELVDAERGVIRFDTTGLWSFYFVNEKPNRFEGDRRTVTGLRREVISLLADEEEWLGKMTVKQVPSSMLSVAQAMAYIARCKCGCGGVTMAAVDAPEHAEDIALSVAECIRDGDHIERVTVEYVRSFFKDNQFGCLADTAVLNKDERPFLAIAGELIEERIDLWRALANAQAAVSEEE